MAVPGLKLFRYAQHTVPMPYVYEPRHAVVAQAAKCVVLVDEIFVSAS
ncbi:AraC family transcriptional regulator N-terminal domain-containing protein [Paraburkholderia strydomiana]